MEPRIIFGNFLDDRSRAESMITISLFPSDLVSYWSRCGLIADFGATFFSYCFPDAMGIKNSLSVILNELVENAVRYSSNQQSDIAVSLYQLPDWLIFEAKNNINNTQKDIFLEQVNFLHQSKNLAETYVATLEQNMSDDFTSGIGLLTMLNDFQVDVAIDFQKEDPESDVWTVIVQVKIKPEYIK